MLLSRDDAQLFFKLHRSLMHFVNQRVQIIPGVGSPDEFAALPPEERWKVRDAFLEHLNLIELFVEQNPQRLPQDELDIVLSWRHLVAGKFYILRDLKKFTVFLSLEQEPVAYGVLALAQSFEEMMGPYLPVMTETILLPFKNQIVYDSLLSNYSISFGPGIRRSMNESFKAAKERHGIVTALPLSANSATRPAGKPKSKAKSRKAPDPKEEAAAAAKEIAGLVDQFCREHLNEEYTQVCLKLVEKLARKRPSPLVGGKPNTWASGIVRTIGWVNFLDDRTQKPHMKLTAIDKAFGVGESTGQGKSMAIRKLFKIRPFDIEWTLPSRQDANPMTWMLSVNGFVMDIRNAPRGAQVAAFEKGLIPYIPADRAT